MSRIPSADVWQSHILKSLNFSPPMKCHMHDSESSLPYHSFLRCPQAKSKKANFPSPLSLFGGSGRLVNCLSVASSFHSPNWNSASDRDESDLRKRSCKILLGLLSIRVDTLYYRVEQKNLAKFSDTCSVRADGLCIGSPMIVGGSKVGNSNMQKIFFATL